MIILGGEPPHIEQPEPELGTVIQRLNSLAYSFEQKTVSFGDNIRIKLDELNINLNDFVNSVVGPTNDHLAARGAVHGETKATAGLSKKDNFRAATLEEQIALTPVDAFVTPQGAKQSIEANNAQFVLDNYQRNDLFQFSSFYFPDKYPMATLTRVEPTRYFGADLRVAILLNNDRLVMSAVSDTAQYQNQVAFESAPVGPVKRTQLGETPPLTIRYNSWGWNQVGCSASNGQIAYFKSLADKKLYQFRNGLTLPGSGRNFLFYRGYASMLWKGLAVGYVFTGTVITMHHRFFYADQAQTNPILQEVVDQNYLAQYDLMGQAPYSGPASLSHDIDLNNYVDFPAGSTVSIAGINTHTIVCSLFWNIQDQEAYLNMQIPVRVRISGVNYDFVLNLTEAYIPGTLLAGGSAKVTSLGSRVKDVINEDGTIAPGATMLRVNSRLDFANPLQSPGAMVGTGELVRAVASKYGIRVKRYQTAEYTNLGEWLMDNNRPSIDTRLASTEVFMPARHNCFTAFPERIIPFSHDTGRTQYLVYGLDSAVGQYKWVEMAWPEASITSTVTADRLGVKVAPVIEENKNLGPLPSGLSIVANKNGAGASVNAMAFSTQNGYRGKASLSYSNKVLTLGADLELSFASLLTLQATAAQVMGRARTANPAVNNALRVSQIQVFALTANKALVLVSDGVCYAEAGIGNYTVDGGGFVLDYLNTNGLKLTPVTPVGLTVPGITRESQTGDGVWMAYSDMLALQTGTNAYQIGICRPFGEVYGDLTFTVSSITGANPVFTPVSVNPAKLYTQGSTFDVTEELYPLVMIPNRGLYQMDSDNTRFTSNMSEIGGVRKFDPFEVNETGWVRLPAGGRVVMNGRTYILDRDYPLKVKTTGTQYCYLVRYGNTLATLASDVRREPNNGELLFGVAVDGIMTVNREYLVMDNRVVSDIREGGAIPCFRDNGGDGVNKFFTQRDKIS